MDSKIYNSILRTILYADIFDFPLKEKEVGRLLCHPERSEGSRDSSSVSRRTQNDIRAGIKEANGVITHKNSFMFLKGREELIAKRMEREAISRQKLKIAKNIVKFLKFIPTIKLIGVSGSVAASNAGSADDIDFFIIAQKGTLWLTRFTTTIVVEFFAQRRHPNDKSVVDKICLNMFVGEDYLAIPKEKQNIYTAHEVCQLKVLYEKDGTYQKFLMTNSWARRFLPKAMANGPLRPHRREACSEASKWQMANIKEKRQLYPIRYTLYAIEWFIKHLQLWYMRRHRTTEVVSEGVLAFHPKDYTSDVLAAFEKRVNEYAAKV